MSFWPIQSSRGPVECLETMPTKDKKTKANELSFEKSREKPIDHSVVRRTPFFQLLTWLSIELLRSQSDR